MEHDRNGTVSVTWRGGDRFDVRIRHHTIRVDQCTDLGGGDTGPAPVELFVASLAACVGHCAERYLHRYQLPAGTAITAHYELGRGPAHAGRIELVVEAPGVPAGLRDSFAAAVQHSAVQNCLRLPPEITFRVRIPEADTARSP